MASEHDAILAINGDYYGFRSDGILIRNGVIYRDSGTRDGMAFYSDGRVEVYDETTTKAQTLLDAGVWNTLSFGPALVNGSKVLSGIDQGRGGHQRRQPLHPGPAAAHRRGVGGEEPPQARRRRRPQRGLLARRDHDELAQIMPNWGAPAPTTSTAAARRPCTQRLDLNQPSNGGERDTSDILYIANGA